MISWIPPPSRAPASCRRREALPPRPGAAQPQPDALIAAVTKMLGKAMAPSQIHVVEGLPKTKNGKIMRRAIRARHLGEKLGDLSALDPLTPLEFIPPQI